MISFNCERVAGHTPGGRIGDDMRETRPGTWRGQIGFTRQPAWNAINSVDLPLWAEDGSGVGFVTRNIAHKSACTSAERRSYYPQYMQCGVKQETVKSYIECLKAIYLFDEVEPWTKSDYAKLGKRPKFFSSDPSLIDNVLGWTSLLTSGKDSASPFCMAYQQNKIAPAARKWTSPSLKAVEEKRKIQVLTNRKDPV